jgi:hypothetical protein
VETVLRDQASYWVKQGTPLQGARGEDEHIHPCEQLDRQRALLLAGIEGEGLGFGLLQVQVDSLHLDLVNAKLNWFHPQHQVLSALGEWVWRSL